MNGWLLAEKESLGEAGLLQSNPLTVYKSVPPLRRLMCLAGAVSSHKAALSAHAANMHHDVQSLVVYGLGSLEVPGIGRTARYQLALALLLREQLAPACAPTQLYDPVFTEIDIKVLDALGCKVMDTNEDGRLQLMGRTLLYMPHCGQELTNNVLDAHWSTLQDLAILGNSFQAYAELWSSADYARRHANKPPKRMLGASSSGRAVELPIDEGGFSVVSAFNNTSLHMFPG
ncbi:hypothetical protein WJX72_005343 [[Myrmecia] bisecta]|uniref:SRR1-like domain-containing protein n=1 Tax=[Myrmecia] bisecta TaxID=41462 RepID=A0AAW1P5U2_9CHLO